MNELISVIIPTYKRSETLERAIKSVMAQTYKNIEIIVVDDNAEYPEYRIRNKKMIEKYKDIIFIENKINLGGGLSRNEGIKKAKGAFLAFLDDDDEFLPEKIEKQYKYYLEINDKKAAMIYCYGNLIKMNGNKKEYKKNMEGNLLLENIELCIAGTSYWFCPKKIIESVGGFEDISSKQDASLLTKLFIKGYNVYCVPEILINFYYHDENNGITKINLKTITAEKQYRKLFLELTENNKCIDEETRKSALYLFSYRLSRWYIHLLDIKNAKIEYKKMKQIKHISKKNLQIFLGIYFNKLYNYLANIKHKIKVG